MEALVASLPVGVIATPSVVERYEDVPGSVKLVCTNALNIFQEQHTVTGYALYFKIPR